MIEKVTTKMVEETTRIWIADDGKEFTTRDACRSYEAAKNMNKLRTKHSRLLIANLKFPYYDWNCETFVHVLYLKNKDDWYTVYDYYTAETGDFWIGDYESNMTFPTTLIVAGNDGYASLSSWTLTDVYNESVKATEAVAAAINAIKNYSNEGENV